MPNLRTNEEELKAFPSSCEAKDCFSDSARRACIELTNRVSTESAPGVYPVRLQDWCRIDRLILENAVAPAKGDFVANFNHPA
jgi:hypothetical protein